MAEKEVKKGLKEQSQWVVKGYVLSSHSSISASLHGTTIGAQKHSAKLLTEQPLQQPPTATTLPALLFPLPKGERGVYRSIPLVAIEVAVQRELLGGVGLVVHVLVAQGLREASTQAS